MTTCTAKEFDKISVSTAIDKGKLLAVLRGDWVDLYNPSRTCCREDEHKGDHIDGRKFPVEAWK